MLQNWFIRVFLLGSPEYAEQANSLKMQRKANVEILIQMLSGGSIPSSSGDLQPSSKGLTSLDEAYPHSGV